MQRKRNPFFFSEICQSIRGQSLEKRRRANLFQLVNWTLNRLLNWLQYFDIKNNLLRKLPLAIWLKQQQALVLVYSSHLRMERQQYPQLILQLKQLEWHTGAVASYSKFIGSTKAYENVDGTTMFDPFEMQWSGTRASNANAIHYSYVLLLFTWIFVRKYLTKYVKDFIWNFIILQISSNIFEWDNNFKGESQA